MLIPVIYPDGKHDLVKDFMLSRLIDDQGIVQFKRKDGWISINADDIRANRSMSLYSGEERRQTKTLTTEIVDIF